VKPLLYIVPAVFLLNLPFGFWREGVRKFSPSWFLAVHAPVPAVIALRILSGMGFQLATVPVVVSAYFAGQFLGGRLRRRRDDRSAAGPGGKNDGV
jgi:hypothetical protein